MKVKAMGMLFAVCAAFCICLPVRAEILYGDVYADAVSDAMVRHYEVLRDRGEGAGNYSSIGYTLSDITGDGIDELVIRQVMGKHLAEYWIYGTDGASCYYMGKIECDAAGYNGDLYGYAPGFLFEEAYKGSLTLGAAEWDGNRFTVMTLYDGSYDRDGNPPTIPELSAYYDPSRLLYEITNFEDLTEGTVVQKKASSSDDKFDLSNYAYRTVITNDEDGALVFQSEPNGSFMFDYEFWDGDQLLVNLDWRQDGYAIAYQDGVFGYVDAGYINWGSTGSYSADSGSTQGNGSSQGNDLEWYRTYDYFEGEDGSVMQIWYDDYGNFDVVVNGDRWFTFNKNEYRIGDSGALEYIVGKNIFSFYPGCYVGIYSRGNEDFYY